MTRRLIDLLTDPELREGWTAIGLGLALGLVAGWLLLCWWA